MQLTWCDFSLADVWKARRNAASVVNKNSGAADVGPAWFVTTGHGHAVLLAARGVRAGWFARIPGAQLPEGLAFAPDPRALLDSVVEANPRHRRRFFAAFIIRAFSIRRRLTRRGVARGAEGGLAQI